MLNRSANAAICNIIFTALLWGFSTQSGNKAAAVVIPTEKELKELYETVKESEMSMSYPSALTLEVIDKMSQLQVEHKALEVEVIAYRDQYDGLKQSIEADIARQAKENYTIPLDDLLQVVHDLEISNLKSILAMKSFSSYTTEELTSYFEKASDEISTLTETIAKMDSKSYSEFLPFLKDVKGSENIEPFSCSEPLSASSTRATTQLSKEDIQQQFDEEWKYIAKNSDLFTRGRETEMALQKRKDQYLENKQSSLSFTSPLMPKGTNAIEIKLEAKMEEICRQFDDLQRQFEALKEDRKDRLEELENAKDENSGGDDDTTCVHDNNDIEDVMYNILHEKRKSEVVQSTEKAKNREGPSPMNLWWMIQSPLFYKTADGLDSLVDFLSGHNDVLDQIIDFLMDITSSATTDEDYVQDSEALLGTNLKKILRKKLSSVEVQLPKQAEPYWKKSGMLKNDLVNSVSKAIHSIPDDPRSYLEKKSIEVQEGIENILDLFRV